MGLPKPYYEADGITLYCADCREILPHLPKVDLVLTDPPYFMPKASGRRLHAYADQRCAKGRIGGFNSAAPTEYPPTALHAGAFDAGLWEWLKMHTSAQIVWGANELTDILGYAPRVLVWDKKLKNGWEDFHSDCEVAWCSEAGPSRMFRFLWAGMLRGGDGAARVHPTEKPVDLIRWCMGFLPDDGTVLDPFCGSGTTLRAAMDLGRKAIGIEIEEKYCAIAVERLRQRVLITA